MLGDLAVILVDLANEELANITYNYPTIPFFLISTADGVCHNGYLEGGIDLLFHPF